MKGARAGASTITMCALRTSTSEGSHTAGPQYYTCCSGITSAKRINQKRHMITVTLAPTPLHTDLLRRAPRSRSPRLSLQRVGGMWIGRFPSLSQGMAMLALLRGRSQAVELLRRRAIAPTNSPIYGVSWGNSQIVAFIIWPPEL